MKADFFVIHCHGYEGLEVSELIGALDAINARYSLSITLPNVSRFTADPMKAIEATRRLGLSLFLCQEIYFSTGNPSDLTDQIGKGIPIPDTGGFKVKVMRFQGAIPPRLVPILEKEIGEAISRKTKANVDLAHPQNEFVLYATRDGFVFGEKIAETSRRELKYRDNEVKPFKHPSTLQPDLSRALLNIARVRAGDLVFDPFCGVGGILLEALEIGAKVMGLDFKRNLLLGAIGNMKHYGHSEWYILQGDARAAPMLKVDRIVTDPPYGRLSPRIRGSTISELYDSLITLSDLILPKGGCLGIICPSKIPIDEMLKEAGFRVLSLNQIKVHASLTRTFVSAER